MNKVLDYISHFIKSTDKLLLALCVLASTFGTFMVYSATMHTLEENQSIPRDVRTMVLAIVLGLIMAMLISFVDTDIICKLWPVFAAVGIGLMIVVLLFGVGPEARSDAKTWINLGIMYFQPSELVKVCFIITFSVHLHTVQNELNSIKNVVLLLLHAMIPVGLVVISGDAGSALVFLLIAVSMMFVAGLNWKYMVAGAALAIAAVPLLWMKMGEFQRARFQAIVHPENFPDTALQQNLGLAALSGGGLTGHGYLKGPYTQAGAVPESENDMIFTVVGEEFGLFGCLLALLILNLIIFRIIHNAKNSIENYTQYINYGIAFMIAWQVLINLAMVLRIGPVIGITLPFFSAGGSSTLCLYIGLGLVFSAYRSNYNAMQETNFRLIGVRSEFNEDFSDSKSATDRKVQASTTVQTQVITGVTGNQFSAKKLMNYAKDTRNERAGSKSGGKGSAKAPKQSRASTKAPSKKQVKKQQVSAYDAKYKNAKNAKKR